MEKKKPILWMTTKNQSHNYHNRNCNQVIFTVKLSGGRIYWMLNIFSIGHIVMLHFAILKTF